MKRKTVMLLFAICFSLVFSPSERVFATEGTAEAVEVITGEIEQIEGSEEGYVKEDTSLGDSIAEAVPEVNQDLLIQSQEPVPEMEDEHPVIESINTSYTSETSGMICLTAIVPNNFGLSVYAQIENLDTGTVYNLPMYAENGYFDRCYVPEGNYAFQIVSVYGDNKGEYSFDFPTSQFYVEARQSAEYELILDDFDKVSLEIQEKRGEIVGYDTTVHVTSIYDVDHTGTGNGELGITGETYDEYFYMIKITKSGGLGEAMFSYSEDMGTTWTEPESIPLSGYYKFGSWNELTGEFFIPEAAETAFVEGDEYSFFVQDPTTAIVVKQEGRSQTEPVIISTTPDMRAFEVLEASGMHIKVKILKGGRFGSAVWQISTDGGLTWGEETYAVEETELSTPDTEKSNGVSFILKFEDYTPNNKSEIFIKDDVFDIYAERTTDNSTVLGILALVAVLGGAGAAAFAGYNYLKKQIPSEDSYRIKK